MANYCIKSFLSCWTHVPQLQSLQCRWPSESLETCLENVSSWAWWYLGYLGCASILLFMDKNKIIAWISWMSQFVDHNLISQSTYKWMPHLLYGYQLGCAPQVKRLMMIFSHMYTPCTGHTIKLPIFVSYKCSLAALRTAEWTHACYINFGHWGTRLWSRY